MSDRSDLLAFELPGDVSKSPVSTMAVQLDSEIDVYADRESGREEWRVTYFDGNSGCYITIFAGPFAEKRARDYANALKARRLAPIPAP